MMDDAVETKRRLTAFIGRKGATLRSLDPVNAAMIRHWCVALGDRNPVYADEALAKATLHGGLIAPPAMLQAWTMPGYGALPADADEGADAVAELYRCLDGLGYSSIVATDSEHEYLRALRLGDAIAATKTIAAISDEKTTALGPGYFVTTAIDIVDANGEPVGRQLYRVLKFKPHARAASAAPSPALPARTPLADASRTNDGLVSTVSGQAGGEPLGERLPALAIPLDRSFIVATAIASRDYAPIHHDPDAARSAGADDIFTNILTAQGLVSRYATDWAGADARLRKMVIRLGARNHPGDTLVLNGEVVARRPGFAGLDIELAVRGTNRLGEHLKASVTLTLPAPSGPMNAADAGSPH